MKNYASLAFTDPVKQLQQRYGSRSSYARMEQQRYQDGLTEQEAAFIADRDSFYLATIGANGYPYIQHRGGPRGFLKVIDKNRLGFVDFTGNKQYISVGNLTTHPQVSLILVDYPRRTRLKIYGRATVVELVDQPELFRELDPADYPHRPERMIVLEIDSYDWNCPQHITPRYTVEEIASALAEQTEYLRSLEAELARYRAGEVS
jgi:uncharacterized protein